LRADKGIWNISHQTAKSEEFEAKSEAEEGERMFQTCISKRSWSTFFC